MRFNCSGCIYSSSTRETSRYLITLTSLVSWVPTSACNVGQVTEDCSCSVITSVIFSLLPVPQSAAGFPGSSTQPTWALSQSGLPSSTLFYHTLPRSRGKRQQAFWRAVHFLPSSPSYTHINLYFWSWPTGAWEPPVVKPLKDCPLTPSLDVLNSMGWEVLNPEGKM